MVYFKHENCDKLGVKYFLSLTYNKERGVRNSENFTEEWYSSIGGYVCQRRCSYRWREDCKSRPESESRGCTGS